MNLIKKVLAFLFSIAVVFILIFFRTVPTGHLWNGYTVLYIQDSVNDRVVSNALKNSGINDYVSLENQRIPILLNNESPELSMLKLNAYSDKKGYLYLRQNYFYDSTGEYRLYYIPNNYKSDLDHAIHYLEQTGIAPGVDSSFSYPWILIAIVLIAGILILLFSKKKFLFLAEAIIPVVYVFCNPFYTAAIAVFLIFVALYLINNLISRKGSLKCLIKNYMIILCLLFSVVAAFSISIISGIFFIAALLGTAAIIFLAKEIKEYRNKKSSFQMVFIKSARMLSVTGGKTSIILPCLLGASVLIFGTFALSSTESVSGHFAKILLPGNSSIASSNLPELEDYYRWNWDVVTYPYKSLNVDSNSKDTIVYPRFEIQSDGRISQINEYYYYDSDFKTKVYENIDVLDFNSIEQVIKIQGDGFSGGYTAASSYNISIFSIIMMILCFIVLLFIYFSVIMKKGGKK